MEIDAQDHAASTMATLDAILGLDHSEWFRLVDSSARPAAPPLDLNSLVQQALRQRPDLSSLNYSAESAKKYARAEWDQLLPSIRVLGTAGVTPVRSDQYYNSNWWGGIGVNLNIPVFNGFLYRSQAKEAAYHAKAAAAYERDLRDRIERDVHVSWLQTQAAYEKLSVTAQLVKQADMSLALAQTRYKLGLSSIVELSQAQLQQTTAQIEATDAHYEYRYALAALRYQIGQAP
jgi:outer membrane protein